MKVDKKVIVVTGAGSGLGRELTLLLLKKGAQVAAADIRDEALQETAKIAKTTEDRLSLHHLDITDKEAVESFPQKVIEHHGRVDGLINNAGIIQPFVKINDLDYESIKMVMKTNFYGPMHLTKALLPILLERPEAHIVNISSMGGFLPVPGQSIYGASKAALKLFTEGLYSELHDSPVRVTIVFPGALQTDIAKNSGIEINMEDSKVESQKFKALAADKAAQIIVKGMEKDKFRILVGSDSKMMDFFYRLNPKFATNLIFKKMKSLLENN